MTEPQSSDTQNPLLADWTGAFGLPPFGAIEPEHFRPAFDRGARRAPRRDRRHRRQSGGAELRQHHRGAGEERARARARRQRVLQPDRRRYRTTPSRRSSARSRRCSPATATRSISIARSMPASTISTTRRETLGLNAEQARVLDRYHTRFVRAGAALEQAGAGAARRHQRAAGEPRHPVRAERAGGREGLRAGAGGERPCRPAAISPAPPRARAAEERGHAGQIRHHAGALLVSSPSCNSRPAAICARRRSRPGSGAARTAAQPTTARSSPRWCACAPSARKLLGYANFADYRLDDRWPRRRQAVRELLDEVWGRRAREGRRRTRRLAGDDRGGGRQLRARRRGTGATTPRSCARRVTISTRPRSSRTSSSTR